MTEKQFYIKCDDFNAWMVWEKGKDVIVFDLHKSTAQLVCDKLNELSDENEQLKQQLTDCKEKKQQMKEFFMNSEPIIEQKKLQKLIYRRVINLIDEKIDEFKNGDYGDLPCNTIHMFLDLKEEIGDVE